MDLVEAIIDKLINKKQKEVKTEAVEVKSNVKGICPMCNSDDLDYGTMELESISGGACYFPWHCNTCGADGKEWYNLDFSETVSNTYDGDVFGSEEGVCPECGEDLDYSDTELEGESFGYEYECPACGSTGTEWYDMTFDTHTINGHEDEEVTVKK